MLCHPRCSDPHLTLSLTFILVPSWFGAKRQSRVTVMCLSTGLSMEVWVPRDPRMGFQIPCSWSSRQLGTELGSSAKAVSVLND